MLIAYTPVTFYKKEFLRDEDGKPYLPGSLVRDAIKTASIFYFIKKDKEIENKVKKYLLSEKLKLEEVVDTIEDIVFKKHPILDGLEVDEKIYLPEEKIKEANVAVFDLKTKVIKEFFKAEVFKGSVDVKFSSPYKEKIKAACHSFCEALARIEHEMLKDHPLDMFYQELLNQIKHFEIPLRLGFWTRVTFGGNLLFFWKIKEVREFIMKKLKVDILPRYILFIPSENATLGWSEIK